MVAMRPRIIWLENSAECPVEVHAELVDKLGLEMMAVIDSPIDKGVPARRTRRLSFLYCAKTFHYNGKSDECMDRFQASPQLNADCYLLASDEDRHGYMRRMSARACNYFSESHALMGRYLPRVSEGAHSYSSRCNGWSLLGRWHEHLRHRRQS
eukprot:7253336-Pyramimonas_sp.AAC.1